jgi:hypothetical protein
MKITMATSLSQRQQCPFGWLASTPDALPLTGQVKKLPSGRNLQNGKNGHCHHIVRGRHEDRAHIENDHINPGRRTMTLLKLSNKKTTSKGHGPRQVKNQRYQSGQHHPSISKKTCSTTYHLPRTMTIHYHHQCQCSRPSTKNLSRTRQAMPQACTYKNRHDSQDQAPYHPTR